MTMSKGKRDQSGGPDAAAGRSGPAASSRAVADNGADNGLRGRYSGITAGDDVKAYITAASDPGAALSTRSLARVLADMDTEAVAGSWVSATTGRRPPDADDPPGLPLTIVLLDAPQPYDECGDSADGKPPTLVKPTAYDARRALPDRPMPAHSAVVYAGGPKALTTSYGPAWTAWWADHHDLTVSTAGWCIYRDWDARKPHRTTPLSIVMELPCLTIDGKRGRVRAAVPPGYWRMCSELTIASRSARMAPLKLTTAYEAEVGPEGFAERWKAYRARRKG